MTAQAQAMGARLADCAPPVAAYHTAYGRFTGEITVERSARRVLHALGHLAGFPPAGQSALTLEKTDCGQSDDWTRYIGAHVMRSTLWADGDLLAERLGPVTAMTELSVSGDGTLAMRLVKWRFLGLRLPRWLAPGVATREYAKADRYHFEVTVTLPILGSKLVRYHGYLCLETA